MRGTRRAFTTGKGKINYSLSDCRIAALDTIGFDWKLGAGATAASKDDKFFARVDKLKAYNEKHGHVNMRRKEDRSLYDFCYTMRQARRAIILRKGITRRKLTNNRIAALDAIGFDWKSGSGATSTVNDAEDKLSPSSFSSTSKLNDVQPVQQSRDGKSIIRQMDNSQGDECHEPSESKVEKSKQMGFFIKVDELKIYKQKHGHLTVRRKEDRSLYEFCCRLRRSRRAIIAGKSKKKDYRLDGDRIAALNAIGFEWELDCKV